MLVLLYVTGWVSYCVTELFIYRMAQTSSLSRKFLSIFRQIGLYWLIFEKKFTGTFCGNFVIVWILNICRPSNPWLRRYTTLLYINL